MRKYLFIAFLSLSLSATSQCMEKPTGNKKIAKNYLTFRQYSCALKELLIIYKEKPTNTKLNQEIAEAYLGVPGSGGKAVPYAEFVISKGKYDNIDLFNLASAYHYAGQYDKSIASANRYVKEFSPVEEELKGIEQLISNCEAAKELLKFPLNIKFENLGEGVNSEWEDMNPFCDQEEGIIYFTTTREKTMGGYSLGNGYISDIFISKYKRNKYSKPRSIGPTLNTIDIDELAGTSADGSHLFVATDSEGFQIFNLKLSYKKPRSRSYPRPKNLDGINQQTSNEEAATITNDGQVLIFSSDREGGYGGLDLYISRKLPNNQWAMPVNLGPEINTEKNENFPRFTEFEEELIFASEGHLNMGGYDLFKTTCSKDFITWSAPVNLGYPINTQFDDRSIWYLENGRYAYKSHYDTAGFGMSDLYRLVLLDSTPQFSILNFTIATDSSLLQEINELELENNTDRVILDSLVQIEIVEDSLAHAQLIDSVQSIINARNLEIQSRRPNCFAEIYVSNSDTEEDYGQYKSNPIKGGVLMILEPGRYDLSIEAEGFHPVNKSLIIKDKTQFKAFIKKEVTLTKK